MPNDYARESFMYCNCTAVSMSSAKNLGQTNLNKPSSERNKILMINEIYSLVELLFDELLFRNSSVLLVALRIDADSLTYHQYLVSKMHESRFYENTSASKKSKILLTPNNSNKFVLYLQT